MGKGWGVTVACPSSPPHPPPWAALGNHRSPSWLPAAILLLQRMLMAPLVRFPDFRLGWFVRPEPLSSPPHRGYLADRENVGFLAGEGSWGGQEVVTAPAPPPPSPAGTGLGQGSTGGPGAADPS